MNPHDLHCACQPCWDARAERKRSERRQQMNTWWRAVRPFAVVKSHQSWCTCRTCYMDQTEVTLSLLPAFWNEQTGVERPGWFGSGEVRTFRDHAWDKQNGGTLFCTCDLCYKMVRWYYEKALDDRLSRKNKEGKAPVANVEQSVKGEASQSIEIEIEGKKYTVHVQFGAEVDVKVDVKVEEKVEEKVFYFIEEFHNNTVVRTHIRSSEEGVRARLGNISNGCGAVVWAIPNTAIADSVMLGSWDAVDKARAAARAWIATNQGAKPFAFEQEEPANKGEGLRVAGCAAFVVSVFVRSASQGRAGCWVYQVRYAGHNDTSVLEIPLPTAASLNR